MSDVLSSGESRLLVAEEAGRADQMLSRSMADLSRSRVQQLIATGHVRLNGATLDEPAKKIKPGDRLELILPAPAPASHLAEAIPLVIVYEDEHLLVIDKPAGLTVHPAPGHPGGTLVNALLAHCGDSLSGIGGVERPGIVHRLDKDTSGLMVVAKNDAAHCALSKQLADRSLSRTYLAFAWGRPQPSAGEIATQLGRSTRDRKKMAVLHHGGREAITRYRTLKLYAPAGAERALAARIECKLATGRTHQIRVHMAHLGHPLIGDPVYGARASPKLKPFRQEVGEPVIALLEGFSRQALHAAAIAFIHPQRQERLTFQAVLPDDLRQLEATLSSL